MCMAGCPPRPSLGMLSGTSGVDAADPPNRPVPKFGSLAE